LEDFKKLIKDLWIAYNPECHRSTMIHFVENLGRIKQATKKWAHDKRVKDDLELKNIEMEVGEKMNDPVNAFSSDAEKEALIILEK
jgi:hypothetical protein